MPVEPLLPVPPEATDVTGPAVVDHRPPADRAYDIHSLLITSCDYGIYTVPQKPASLSAVALLRNEMATAPGDPWHGHTIEVRRYAAYLNAKRALKGSVGSMYGGLLPMLMLRAGEKCSETEMHGGWYAGSEIVNALSPLIVEMIVSVDGKVYNVRSVYSPRVGVTPKLKQPTDDSELTQAMIKADRALLARMGTAVPTAQPVTPGPVAPPTSTAPAKSSDDDGFVNFPSHQP
ncbi:MULTISPECIES: hypothetical protein [Rhodanobacteraceae]|uniref:hypothetical protein n=1 Tax=Rhodanobacteraceae TaxID=1775411 RepID=UPI00088DBE25|nr:MULTISPECIES: hypothetical protein [Rhodanobacteraceae]SDG20718.1 hypothetical protein SAMN04515659_2395 [Dyella sp. 333MFSha]SKB55382.1 hypothetical protein SAMN05660880_01586 [Luteibacter sp. 22Crub2.1]